MSRIQSAFDKAENPDSKQDNEPVTHIQFVQPVVLPDTAEEVKPGKALSQSFEPRLSSIRFYEAAESELEKDIQNIRKQTKEIQTDKSNQHLLLGIVFFLVLSLLASRFWMNSKKSSKMNMVSIQSTETKPPQVLITQQEDVFHKKTSQVKLTLTGITSANNQPLALINNQVVGMGDKLREGAIVKSIHGQEVILELDGRKIALSL